MTTKFLAALTTVQELSINLLPESMIGCCALLACGEILAGIETNSLELA
jgi:hypothetical protein